MGGASRRGGSDTSDERKQDSYSKQFRKQYTVNKKTGDVKKRNIISRILINSPTGTVVGDFADNHNYKRRLKFAEKNNLNLISKSKEYLMSPAAKSYLDEFGYADTLKDKTGINNNTRDRDSDNQNKPILEASTQPVNNNVTTPTNAEITQAQSTEMSADQILLANKKKGRLETILQTAQGLGDSTANTTKKKLGA
jgi:hypothetical protein